MRWMQLWRLHLLRRVRRISFILNQYNMRRSEALCEGLQPADAEHNVAALYEFWQTELRRTQRSVVRSVASRYRPLAHAAICRWKASPFCLAPSIVEELNRHRTTQLAYS